MQKRTARRSAGHANYKLLNFPYGGRFNTCKRSSEKPIEIAGDIGETSRAPEASVSEVAA